MSHKRSFASKMKSQQVKGWAKYYVNYNKLITTLHAISADMGRCDNIDDNMASMLLEST